MSKANESNILVLDVEGTDGRERGEDQDFERKSALFSLTIAEVVIINMWENMIGLYNGAKMGLLKTVFEVNLELFRSSESPKTHLQFIIRDFTGVTPLQNLSDTLLQDLNKIWTSLAKPQGKEGCKLHDFFDTSFAALPHKVFANEKFNQEALLLSKRYLYRIYVMMKLDFMIKIHQIMFFNQNITKESQPMDSPLLQNLYGILFYPIVI